MNLLVFKKHSSFTRSTEQAAHTNTNTVQIHLMNTLLFYVIERMLMLSSVQDWEKMNIEINVFSSGMVKKRLQG